MADKIRIAGVPPYDGEYDFDFAGGFTTAEWRTIKKISGVLPLTLVDAWRAGDQDLWVALALIVLERAGKPALPEVFDRATGAITFVEDKGDAGPPALTPSEPSAEPNGEHGSSGNANGSHSSGRLEIDQSRTGSQPSDIGVTSGRETSAA